MRNALCRAGIFYQNACKAARRRFSDNYAVCVIYRWEKKQIRPGVPSTKSFSVVLRSCKYDLAVRICEENNIPWQTKTKIAGGNDAGAIQSAGDGVRVLAVSVPCRYLHSPYSVIRYADAEACGQLAELLLCALPAASEGDI